MSTNPSVGFQTRYYSASLTSASPDYQKGSPSNRTVTFDIPVRVIAINGACVSTLNPSRFTERNMNLAYKLLVEYSMGDKLHTEPRLGSTVVGTAQNPGEIGGHGFNVDQGGSLIVQITPLFDPEDDEEIIIDLTFVCLEMRAPRNFSTR